MQLDDLRTAMCNLEEDSERDFDRGSPKVIA